VSDAGLCPFTDNDVIAGQRAIAAAEAWIMAEAEGKVRKPQNIMSQLRQTFRSSIRNAFLR
jgi:hypothetical protein